MRKKVLVIEDEPAIRDMISLALDEQFRIFDAETTQQARSLLYENTPDCIILDWMLPGESGVQFLKTIKQDSLFKHIPIIMLTAKAEEENKVKCFDAGVDDYVTKPFSPKELQARIKSIMRRGPIISPNNLLEACGLTMNLDSHQVIIESNNIELTPNEYKLLKLFLSHPEKVFSRDQIITQLWGGNSDNETRTVDVLVRRLRDKLKPNHHEYITTVRGSGYQFTQGSVCKN